MTGKTWLITGCSSGFGRSLSEKALSRGDKVLMTVRNIDVVGDLVARYPDRARSFVLDVADLDRIPAVVAQAAQAFGDIDVLVNNAGYALFGGIEEATTTQYRRIFETNFFGALEVMRSVLPVMRRQGQGRIVNVSSMAGISGGLAMGYYAATKFALAAVSESLALETAHLGIKVTVLEPGAHRTAVKQNWQMADPIDDYAGSIGKAREMLLSAKGDEPGDPVKVADAILLVADAASPPLHLPLGRDALARAEARNANVAKDIETWRSLVLSTAL